VLGLPVSADSARARARVALAEVGLEQQSDAWPVTLSGGEAQRVALARALVRDPELLLLDEPFGALDALTRIKMHALLAQLFRRHHPAVLLVTHDVDEALLLADRAVVLGKHDDQGDARGSSVIADVAIDVPAPRRRSDPRYLELRSILLSHLGVDGEATEEVSSIRARTTGASAGLALG
jgi:sulfonate transport system ATP-binding protein